MVHALHLLSHAAQDLFVFEGKPLTVCTAAYSDLPIRLTAGVSVNGGRERLQTPTLAQDLSSKIPVECYVFSAPRSIWGSPGRFNLRIQTDRGELTSLIHTFQASQFTYTAQDDQDVREILGQIRVSTYRHVTLRLAQGVTFNFPRLGDADLAAYTLADSPVLVTIEPTAGTATLNNHRFPLQFARYQNLTFSATDNPGVACYVLSGTVASIRNCRFTSPLGDATTSRYGLYAANASVNADLCTFDNLNVGAASVGVIRNSVAKYNYESNFMDVDVLQGNLTEGAAYGVVYKDAASPVLHSNLFLNTTTQGLRVLGSFTDGLLVGNVFHSLGEGARFYSDHVSGSTFLHNTFRAAPGYPGYALEPRVRFFGNRVVNNAMTKLDLRVDTNHNVWDYNATESGECQGDHSLSAITFSFANDYCTLLETSQLRGHALEVPGYTLGLGILPYGRQIGALPWVISTSLSSTLGSVLWVNPSNTLLDGDVLDVPSGELTGVLNYVAPRYSETLPLI